MVKIGEAKKCKISKNRKNRGKLKKFAEIGGIRNMHHWLRAVLPNMCAAAHKCAARAVEVCRGRMLEIKSFQWEVSL